MWISRLIRGLYPYLWRMHPLGIGGAILAVNGKIQKQQEQTEAQPDGA